MRPGLGTKARSGEEYGRFTISRSAVLTLARYGAARDMTYIAHIPEADRDGRIAKIRRLASRLLFCRKAATISEYGLIAVLLVSAAGVAHSPRLHAVKDTQCDAPQASCFRSHPAAGAHTGEAKLPVASRPAPQQTASEPGHAKGAPELHHSSS